MLYLRGLLTVPASTAVTLAFMEPVTAATLGIVVLGEQVTPAMLAGMGLILGGLAILTLQKERVRCSDCSGWAWRRRSFSAAPSSSTGP